MSQYPSNPNYNPYGQNPSDPNYQGTSYGGSPSGPNQGQYPPYNQPGTNPNPYSPNSQPGIDPNAYNPYAPNPPTPAPQPNTGPNYNPYDPYAPTAAGTAPAYTNPYEAPPAPPPVPTPPQRKPGLSPRIIGLIALVLVLILGGILFAFISYNNTQTANNNATATARSNATSTAQVLTQQTAVAATATTIASTYPFSNKQVLNDPLTDNSKGFGWDTNNFCKFEGSAYHIIDPQTNTFGVCAATKTNFSNFTFQAEMLLSKGDGAGLIFRADSNETKLYRVTFFTDNTYQVVVYVDTSGTNARILKNGSLPTSVDMHNTNTVAVVARGNTFTIYMNQQVVATVTDSTYSQGLIGFTTSDVTNAAEAVFTNAQVWQLP